VSLAAAPSANHFGDRAAKSSGINSNEDTVTGGDDGDDGGSVNKNNITKTITNTKLNKPNHQKQDSILEKISKDIKMLSCTVLESRQYEATTSDVS